MSRLLWEQVDRSYETGVDRGVLYPKDGLGTVWNGLISVKESPSDSAESTQYFDGAKYQRRRSPGSFSGTIEAFTYPDVLDELFSQRRRQPFDMAYRVQTNSGYKIHLVYNVLLAPSSRDYQQKDPLNFSWGFTTKSYRFPEGQYSAHLIVDTAKAYSSTIASLEDVLYGTDSFDAHMPDPVGVIDIFEENSIVQVIDNGDGTWTAIGPDDIVAMIDATTFQIDWPSAVYIDADSYKISSL